MNKFLAIGFVLVSTCAFAEDAKPNKMSECAAKWRETKATDGFKPEKGQYRAHMTVCLKKSPGPVTR